MRPLARARGTLRRALHRPVDVWWHPTFRLPVAGFAAEVGMDPRRGDFVLTWLLDTGITRPEDVREAPEAPFSWLRQVHTEAYLESLDRPETVAQIVAIDARRIATAPLLETWRHAVGGVVEAAKHVVAEGGRAAVLLGGFHHAAPDHGGGFCALNDVAIAVSRLREAGFAGRILVIDTDAHPPDGLAACLARDELVKIYSISVATGWPDVPGITDARVPPGTGDEGWLAALRELLSKVEPADLAFVLAGADPLKGDRFGALACTEAGLRERDRLVLAALGNTPTVLLPAGGYTPGAWRVFAATIAEASGSQQEVRRDYDPVLRRTRDIAATLQPHDLGAEEFLTAEDVAEALGLPTSEPRVLGFYTRHGIEYALSRYGLLPALRRMGFEKLVVETRAESGPHRIRVLWEHGGTRETLVETVLSMRPIERWHTLFVDWLSLRDPRVPFTKDRPRLPGQDVPGLGLAEEVMHLLVRMAERLGLAGVSFVPAHYHIAWISRGRFHFVDPDDRGRFFALMDHLKTVPLLEASAILDGPGLATEDGGVVKWEPKLMVAPLDPGLAAWLAEGDARAEAVREGTLGMLLRN
jgi:acetoin utilization deacetylase AcuC-like enzyme